MTERTVVLGSSTFKGAFILVRNKSSVSRGPSYVSHESSFSMPFDDSIDAC
jgi:hypothetical protein